MIELVGVCRTFFEAQAERVVLHEVDLDVRRGEIAVVVGRSGSGKSTLLNLVSGLDRPTAGTVRIAGCDLTAMSETERTLFRRLHIGFVFQFFNLIPTLTVEENLLLPLELQRRLTSVERRRALDLLAEVGLADRAASFPDVLSGGEQQRVAIARALAHEPDLVVADEPTGNLDLDTGLVVLDLLDRMVRQTGRTMLMVTHSREVVGVADRLFETEGGTLRERSTGHGKDRR